MRKVKAFFCCFFNYRRNEVTKLPRIRSGKQTILSPTENFVIETRISDRPHRLESLTFPVRERPPLRVWPVCVLILGPPCSFERQSSSNQQSCMRREPPRAALEGKISRLKDYPRQTDDLRRSPNLMRFNGFSKRNVSTVATFQGQLEQVFALSIRRPFTRTTLTQVALSLNGYVTKWLAWLLRITILELIGSS